MQVPDKYIILNMVNMTMMKFSLGIKLCDRVTEHELSFSFKVALKR